MKVKLAIFDLDQTLIDTLPRFYRVFNKTLKIYGLPEVDWRNFIDRYKRDDLDALIFPPTLVEDFWDTFLRIYDEEHFEDDKVIGGVIKCLSFLKNAGIRVVVVTGRKSSRERVWENLRYHGLDRYINEVYTAENLKNHEFRFSKKELIIEIMKKYGVLPSEVIFVGDYKYDMMSGRKAGVFTIGVLTGYESRETLLKYGADVVVESVASIPEYLKKMECEKGVSSNR